MRLNPKYFLILLLIPVLLVLAAMVQMRGREVIFFSDGTAVECDTVWEVGDRVHFQTGDEVLAVPRDRVKAVGRLHLKGGRNRIRTFVYLSAKSLSKMAQSVQIWWFDLRQILEQFNLNDILIWWATGAAALFCGAVFYFSRRRKKAVPIPDAPEEVLPMIDMGDGGPDARLRGAIAGYFLNLYQRQFTGVEALGAENVSVDLLGDGRVYVFELTVSHDGQQSRRRMTIGPLGEGTGSKSKCFYVIYDQHMVVKIPPAPIADLATYLTMLAKEAGVAEKTAPLESIVPRVALILRRIHPFPDGAFSSVEQMEEAYVSLLKKDPDYQKFLKINDQFVFFMDLSQYYFLGHIIKEINDGRKKLTQELSRYTGLIWDPPGFAGRYGQNAENLCFKIQYLFAECESKVKKVLEKHETGKVYDHNVREWFAEFLVSQAISENAALSGETRADVNQCMAAEFSENKAAVDEYLRLVKRAVFRRMQIQSRPMKRAVVENLLSLLAHLKKSKVAMRDLKPDNLLAVGDPNDFPGFLSHSKKYHIGLIDMETAVVFAPGKGKPADQPQLGGTPSYATPSHFFPNELLSRCYGDLPRLFHLQDWQAVLAMIYNVVTGDRLFAETSRLFPAILGRLRNLAAKGADPNRLMAETGRLFWRGAMSEFTEKTNRCKPLLDAVSIEIPTDAVEMLREEISGAIMEADKWMDQWIASQSVVSSEKGRRQLKAATAENLARLAGRLKSAPATPKNKERLSLFLELGHMKAVMETQIRIMARMDEIPATMSGLEVITVMFHMVHGFMFKPEWNRGR